MFTRQTVSGSWLEECFDSGFGWLMSFSLHVVVLLGLTLLGIDSLVSASGSSPNLLIGFHAPPWIVDPVNTRTPIDGAGLRSFGELGAQIRPWTLRDGPVGGVRMCEGDYSGKESDDSPVAVIADELASVFKRAERTSECVLCTAERRTGRRVTAQGIGPAGLCCRHVILLEHGPDAELRFRCGFSSPDER